MIEPGTQIGKYVLDRELGRGGYGVIYLARDAGLDREVALKLLRAEHLTNREVVQRFLREARAAAKIEHPGIVTVYECGAFDDPLSEHTGTVYIAMEVLRGETLTARLGRGRPPLAHALGICRQAASALGAAHGAGIVHRDLKPDNVFLCPDRMVVGGERVKLLDFGIAKLAEPNQPGELHTHAMMVLGTPRYMSPEQCRSSTQIDARSDIYTLGCMLFELLSGQTPYDGNASELIARHQLAPVPALRMAASDVPPSVELLVTAMLAKEPDDRPQTMAQVEAELERFAARAPTASGTEYAWPEVAPVPVAFAHAPTLAISPVPPPLPLPSPARREIRRVVLALFAVLVACAAVAVAVGIGSHDDASPPAPPAPIAASATRPPVGTIDAAVDAAPAPPDAAAIDAAVAPPDAGARAPKPAAKPVSAADAACADHARHATAAISSGQHEQALTELEGALQCHPDDPELVAKAYGEACATRRRGKAHQYFSKLPATGARSKEALRHLCLDVGIAPGSHRTGTASE